MLFEVAVFLATISNAISRPRNSATPLASTLHRDGALFFFVRLAFFIWQMMAQRG
jgi:hypothetical protein